MNKKIISAILMATLLFFNFAYGQNRVEKNTKNKTIFGKKSYNYKHIGKQKVEKMLRQTENSNSKTSQNKSNSQRRGSFGGNSGWNNSSHNAKKKHFGFDCHDFGYSQTFNPILDRASNITLNMNDMLRLKRNQEFDIFRLNVLFLSDMHQLKNKANNFAYGASYGNPAGARQLEKLIKQNYFYALEDILKHNQIERLDYYFTRFDLLGNRAFASYGNYNFGSYGNSYSNGNNNNSCGNNGNCGNSCNHQNHSNNGTGNYGFGNSNNGNTGYNQYGYFRKSKTKTN